MQLIDVAYPNLHEHISAVDRIYMAPELKESSIAEVSKAGIRNADTFSLGAILYILVIGG